MLSHDKRPKPGDPSASRNNGTTAASINNNKATKPSIAFGVPYSTYPSSSHPGRSIKHCRWASHPNSSPSSRRHFSHAAQQRALATMKDDPSIPSSHTDGLEAFPQAKPSAQPSTPSTTTSRSASIASNSTTASASTAATSIVAALAQDKPATVPTRAATERRRRSNPHQLPSTMMTHDTAVRRVHDLEAALSTARTQQHRLAVELEKLRMQQTAQQGSRRTSLPGTNVPSIFSRSPSISTDGGSTVSGSGDQEWGITDLMAEAARNCERMEDRLAFQRQIVALRDKIYAQAEELNERKRERKEWKEEKEELIRELKERDERIKGLEKTGIQG